MNAVAQEDRPWELVVVVGASAGGIEALQRFVRALPPNLPLALLIVLHVPASGSSLPQILARAGAYPAAHAVDGEPIEPGRIMIAPPDHHLVVEGRIVRVRQTQREDGYRPAIDTLFRSAAQALGPNVVGVILAQLFDISHLPRTQHFRQRVVDLLFIGQGNQHLGAVRGRRRV